jgi:Leucine-rich repeat (LRR) protein
VIVEAIWRDLTTGMLFSGLLQPTHVSSSRARPADQSQEAVCAALEADGSQFDPRHCFQVGVNQLTSLPPELGLLTNLKELSVRQPRHTHLDLTALSRFQVADNQLTSLPAEVGQLTRLQMLLVRNSN